MKLSIKRALVASAVSAAIAAPMTAHATNGMNLEGYGPIAAGMGGASMAYDNGAAATMNNPATIGLMEEGDGRLDLALGVLGPDVGYTSVNGNVGSDATAFFLKSYTLAPLFFSTQATNSSAI